MNTFIFYTQHSLNTNVIQRVKLGHMDCFVQDSSSGVRGLEEVTFLFRLCDGSSPKSYGINVARLAGLPQAVINSAFKQSQIFETKMKSDLNSCQTRKDYKRFQSYFEKLISIAGSDFNITELAFYAKELWRRLEFD